MGSPPVVRDARHLPLQTYLDMTHQRRQREMVLVALAKSHQWTQNDEAKLPRIGRIWKKIEPCLGDRQTGHLE